MQLLLKQLESVLSDSKISSLVIAALRFDEDLMKGLIPITSNTIDQISFEEIVQVALKCSLHNFSESDSAKRKLEGEAHLLVPLQNVFCKSILKKAQSSIDNRFRKFSSVEHRKVLLFQ